MIIDTSTVKWIGETLDEMDAHAFVSTADRQCPHCRRTIRFETIAREEDIELFQLMIESAHEVMDRHDITANLLAEIRAQCMIEIARRNQG